MHAALLVLVVIAGEPCTRCRVVLKGLVRWKGDTPQSNLSGLCTAGFMGGTTSSLFDTDSSAMLDFKEIIGNPVCCKTSPTPNLWVIRSL